MSKVWPIKAAADRAKLRDITNTHGGWLALFHDISSETGWRTGDVCALRFDAIDFDSGLVSIQVAKQTKAARTRAYMGQVRKFLKERLQVVTDAEFRRYSLMDPADFIPELTAEQLAACEAAKAAAKGKEAVIMLSLDTLDKIAALRDRDTGNPWVFARQFTECKNSNSLAEGPITRQSVWKAFRKVGAELKAAGVRVAKFSAYSLRKSFLYAMKQAFDAEGKDGTAMARDAVGHSSIEMTKRYLMLDLEEMQNRQRTLFAAEGMRFAS